jgi:CHAT domain
MNRIVVQLGSSVAPNGDPFLSISLEEPSVFGSQTLPFLCSAADAEFAALRAAELASDSIKVAGGKLFKALADHPDIAGYLTTALQTGAGGRYPVFVEIATPAGAEALPWEALCTPTGEYLGLDERWAVARIVDPHVPGAPFYTLTPPLRVAAVLSCLGIPAAGELAALRAAVRRAGPEHVQLLVVASEEQLIVDLRAEMDAGTAPEVAAAELVPPDLEQLQQLVVAFGPHVLHLFCHGSLKGSPHIALARKSDWTAAAPTSGILAEARDFHGFTGKTDDLPWLVVLNCCEGAGVAAEPDSQSLALALAIEGIAPAVVGMREPVVSDTANVLTKTLYSKLFSDLAARIGAAGRAPQPLDWPCAVVAARDRLARVHDGVVLSEAAASTKEWTLPVMYVRPDEFRLQVVPVPEPAPPPVLPAPMPPVPPAPGGGDAAPPSVVDESNVTRATRLEIEALHTLLVSLPPDQAPELKAEADNRITELTATLRVDLPPSDAVAPATP